MSGAEVCTVESCERKRYARSLCNPHYLRWYRTGSASEDVRIGDLPIQEDRECSVDGCGRPHYGHGLCQTHYARERNSGSVQADVPIISGRTPEERFMSHVQQVDNGCWMWTSTIISTGYGQFGRGSREEGAELAHRWSYEHFVGPIPEGLFVLHHCDVRPCVNPDHLYAGTHRDNMDDVIARGRSRKVLPVACNKGHEYVDGSWTWRPTGDGRYNYRACKECACISSRAYYERKKAGQ
jgi:HNH endonuclease